MPFTGSGSGIQNADDVYFSVVSRGQTLRYNSVTSKWVNGNSTYVSVMDFGAKGNGVVDDTTAIQNSIDAAAGQGPLLDGVRARGSSVYFPAGTYLLSQPLKLKPFVDLVGNGMNSSRLYNNTSQLVTIRQGEAVANCSYRNLSFETGSSGSHIFDLDSPDPSGYLAWSSFQNCSFYTRSNTSSIFRVQNNAQFIGVSVSQSILERPSSGGSTVPAIDLDVIGRTCNSITWRDLHCHGRNTTAKPFFYIRSQTHWNYNLTFENVCGEQNGGGFIHLVSANGVRISNCPDWDFVDPSTDPGRTKGYYNHVYYFASTATAGANGIAHNCRNIVIENSCRTEGSLGQGGGGSLVNDIRADSAVTGLTITHCEPSDHNTASFVVPSSAIVT